MPPLSSSSRSFVITALLAAAAAGFSCSQGGAPAFDADSSFAVLEEQCAMGYRYPGSAAHRRLQRYIARKLKSGGANVSVQPFTAVLSTGDTLRNTVNIIGNYNLNAGKRIMLAAHYDTRAFSDMDPDPANRSVPVTGANDGASGVAVLLEIARLLGEHSPPVGVDLVFFDAEDQGEAGKAYDFCLGAKHFSMTLKGYRPFAAIVIDMIGDADLRVPVEGYSSAAAPALVDEVYGIAERLGIGSFDRSPGPAVVDDHLPLIQAGIDAIDLIDLDYDYWHTVEDTPDKCSPASLEDVGRVLLEYIWTREGG